MSLQDLKEQARQLNVNDRLELVRSIIESLQEMPSQPTERSRAIKHLRPFGLCAGAFIVPDDFDAPLPEEILSSFVG